MDWTITILCENTVSKPGLIGEHGFSALVEGPDKTILFDTGQGFGLVPNALRLQKDLRRVDLVALSHGHYDHTGGLLDFLGVHGPCDFVAHPDVLKERFRWVPVRGEEKLMSIGLPWHKAYLTSRGARFRWETRFSEIAPGVLLTGEVPRKTDFESGDPKFAILENGEWVPDPFRDDYSLVIKTQKGLVIILGCAHAGLVNILEHAVEQTGEPHIHAVLGGTHLGFSPEAQLTETIAALKERSIDLLAVSHCTGQKPVVRLAGEFGERFDFAPVGFTLEV